MIKHFMIIVEKTEMNPIIDRNRISWNIEARNWGLIDGLDCYLLHKIVNLRLRF